MSGTESDNLENAVNCADVFLLDGAAVSAGTARRLITKMALADMWDESEVHSIWSRLLDQREEYSERLECAEAVTRITQDRLEILLVEPA